MPFCRGRPTILCLLTFMNQRMEKLLSIVVPTYNMQALLTRCLESLLLDNATYLQQLEIIVVNDGSKDNSSLIARDFAVRYPQTIVVIDKSNGNYGSCINAALKVATGKYFRICDADDKYLNANMSSYLQFLEMADTDIVLSPYMILSPDETVDKEFKTPTALLGRTFKIDELMWEKDEMLEFRQMHCLATKTKLLIDNHYVQSEGISYTDSQFVFYSHLYAQTCSFFENIIYCYYLGREGQTMSKASMLKSHHHFYENACRMVQEFVNIAPPLAENKRRLLMMTLYSVLIFYTRIIFSSKPEEIDKLKWVLDLAKTSRVKCDIDTRLLKNSAFRLWKKIGISPRLISLFKRW